jgi:hypothetical protein
MSDARIVTNYEYPPIPDRRFDWSAIDDNTYDGADDSNCPIGRGATENLGVDLKISIDGIPDCPQESTDA